jgi:nitronate monooxygenase
MDPLRTPLCDLLGIEVPIFQAPMASAATPELVAAVSNAGGLGMLPGAYLAAEQLRAEIRAVKKATSKPFAVNLLLHPAMQPPPDPDEVPGPVWSQVLSATNAFRRELGLRVQALRPPRPADLIPEALEVIFTEDVPVLSIGLGQPSAALMARCRERGMKVVAMACTVPDALALVEAGVDVVVAQGGEAGGHRSTWVKRPSVEQAAIGTMVLVPELCAATTVPVVAAGGIAVGSQLAAALALGAAGVHVGTRFLATAESRSTYKDVVVGADSDSTRITDVFSGLHARVVRNRFSEEYSGAVLPPMLQQAATADIRSGGDREFVPLYAGQSVGLIGRVEPAAEVMRALCAEARAALDRLRGSAVP